MDLAGRIVRYFQPTGLVLEPCAGGGHFFQHLPDAEWCEIKRDRDFAYDQRVDWILTNLL